MADDPVPTGTIHTGYLRGDLFFPRCIWPRATRRSRVLSLQGEGATHEVIEEMREEMDSTTPLGPIWPLWSATRSGATWAYPTKTVIR